MKELKEIHAQLITVGLIRYTYITSRLLAFCAVSENGDLNYSESIFHQIKLPTIFNWNTMIKAYSKSSKPEKGLEIFIKMRNENVNPNMHTFPILIKSCVGLPSLSQVHCQIVKFALDIDVYIISSLIKSYSNWGLLDFARKVFDESLDRNIVCWTSLITGYCDNGLVSRARKLFDEMPERNDVSWSAMISGYVRNNCFSEAIALFRKLKKCSGSKPNPSLLVSVLNACANLGASKEGKWVHSYIYENGFGYGLELGTALVDFYAKCGFVEMAQKVFYKMPRKDVTAWSAMISGLAINGCGELALKVFMEMEKSEIKPNAVTFVGILTACSHGGLVDEGWRFFKHMTNDYGISPTIEHFGCMVDLLGRAGQIEEAERLISRMPMEPDGIIWGALLNGCLMHGNVKLGVKVGEHLVELEPQHSGRYVLLANLYAKMDKWDGVSRLRRMMRDRNVATVTGSSVIEINGDVHRFKVEDKSHPQTSEIYKLVNQLSKELITSTHGTL
ncbi:Pentatricopeptide repeat [Macleaya cordata]|uniref:Pentatricopeptide repeat n=1 Tax=Macleaya cordata TaxID=56857 RepID=A0A200RE04_MACCD|nr:Pentatricopeptide repeat [Macleaya cordata]